MRKGALLLCGGVRSLSSCSSLYYVCVNGDGSVETAHEDMQARLSHRYSPIRTTFFTVAGSNIARTSVTHLYQ